MATRPQPPGDPESATELATHVSQHAEDWIVYLRKMLAYAVALEKKISTLRSAANTHDSAILSLRTEVSNRDCNGLKQLFEVAPAACTDEPGGPHGGQRELGDQVLSQFKALAEAIKDSDRKAAAEIGEQSRVSANMWLKRTGWPRHLQGFDREWLASMTAQPRDPGKGEDRNHEDDEEQNKGRVVERATSEEALSRVLLAVERVIWRAQRVSRVDVVGSAAINYISRREAGGDSNEKPFHAEQKAQTMERYTESWKSVVAYIWRTAHLSPADATEAVKATGSTVDGETDGEMEEDKETARHLESGYDIAQIGQAESIIGKQRPGYQFNAYQAEVWDRLQDVAYGCIRAENPGGKGDRERQDPLPNPEIRDEDMSEAVSEDASEDASEDKRESSYTAKPDIQALERWVLEFFIALLDHDIGDKEFQNALYSGLAVLGIHVGHGWRSALIYTPRLSAIVTVAWMLVLYKAKQDRDQEVERRQKVEGETEQEARRQVRTHFDRVREMVQWFMTIVAFDGQSSPMGSILRLRAYGKAIRANTNADGVVDWHGDELLYGHVQFSMASLRMMVHGLLHSTRAQLRQDVLLLETDGGQGETVTEGMPQIQWDRLVDNAAETRAGWSFVDDRRNDEAWKGVDDKMWLAGRMAAEEKLRDQFIETGGESGESSGGAVGIRWKMDRVRKYGEAMKSFRCKLLVLMHMSGGQPARGTELVTVQY
ncbi:hypothetical protein QBC38DRAFT_527612, partial [Podospora fimiseda]